MQVGLYNGRKAVVVVFGLDSNFLLAICSEPRPSWNHCQVISHYHTTIELEATETVRTTLPRLNVPVAVSKSMRAVKLCTATG